MLNGNREYILRFICFFLWHRGTPQLPVVHHEIAATASTKFYGGRHWRRKVARPRHVDEMHVVAERQIHATAWTCVRRGGVICQNRTKLKTSNIPDTNIKIEMETIFRMFFMTNEPFTYQYTIDVVLALGLDVLHEHKDEEHHAMTSTLRQVGRSTMLV